MIYFIVTALFLFFAFLYIRSEWEEGRQATCKYYKRELYSFKIKGYGFDCYLLRYFRNSVLPEHTDPVEGGKHFRLNIGWGEANFVCEKYIIYQRIGKLTIIFFRPDLYKHSLYVFEDTRKISFGLVIPSK